MNSSSSSSGGTTMASTSGSSNSHPSTASGSSGSHPSGTSMDTEPTQDVTDGPLGDEEEEEEQQIPVELKVWGRLLSLQSNHFQTIELKEENYTFGREQSCSFVFKMRNFKSKEEYFRSISKRHFEITRNAVGNDHEVFLTDRSTNGTFLNGEKLGKDNKHHLRNNDEIAFPVKKNKVYVFNDVSEAEKENERFPEVLKSKYSVGKLLGSGACGEVRLCFKKPNMDRFAVKILSKKKFSVSTMKESEVRILQSLNHSCIVNIEEVIESEDHLYIILELVSGGELFDRVVAVKRFDEPTAKILFYQMLLAVQYLHRREITHRDLKPENVLLATDDKETVIKITDFGLSRFVPENTLMRTLCGTPNYLAPEVDIHMGGSGYGKKCDCWSLGCILYICLGGYPPFPEEDDTRKPMKERIRKGEFTFPNAQWGSTSDEAKGLIRRFLTVDPNERISVDDALQHPWLQDDAMKERVEELLAQDRQRRASEASEGNGSVQFVPPSTPRSLKRSQESTFSEEAGTSMEKKQRLDS